MSLTIDQERYMEEKADWESEVSELIESLSESIDAILLHWNQTRTLGASATEDLCATAEDIKIEAQELYDLIERVVE